ncbi:DUF5958 family protein [Spirosoma fluviale]|uniref:Uncharacterized protein n=1 Tax=Spirosoma fluviale TaxID=1597977 RepID=A0A286FEA6_9BACT|nr:DUF5958 family protein [Spirosoma fluviale]SOD81533.1 hypothetical protein SAMN06269250_1824 [Spirosoma fluviale]
MSLDEEIAIYQFGQGISSHKELVAHFMQLTNDQKKISFYELHRLIRQLNPLAADIEVALTESPLDDSYTSGFNFTSRWLKMTSLTQPEEENNYIFLLYLFKTTYQRHYQLKKQDPENWRYQDLSNPEIVQNILKTHQNLVETIYSDPSYRSEFLSLAKLWNDRFNFRDPNYLKPTPEHANQYMNYDDLVTAYINTFSIKNMRSIGILRNSLEKALSRQYKVDAQQVERLISEITERYLRENYNTTFNQ